MAGNEIHMKKQPFRRLLLFMIGYLLFTGCSGFLPGSGPSTSAIMDSQQSVQSTGIQVVDISDQVARRLISKRQPMLFSEALAPDREVLFPVGAGDVLEVTVWEAPPAALFGTSSSDLRSGTATSRVTPFPEQMVSSEGTIFVPFVGSISVVGKSLQQVENTIAKGLKDKANQPQVLVRLSRNSTANVTLVGEVGASTRMPLTPKGERLLDALAAAGGVRQPINKMTVQITRRDKVYALPLEQVIRDPKQNIVLQPDDVITALYQPLSFTVLGATGKNEEINFEAQGISLTQALARSGGLQDMRADAQGLFIFRFEDEQALDWPTKPVLTTPDKRVPVVYRMNLRDPASFLVAQNFPISNKDVLYVANAPATELQKFLNIVMTLVYPVINVIPLTR